MYNTFTRIHTVVIKKLDVKLIRRAGKEGRKRVAFLEAQEEFVARNRSQQSPAARRNDPPSF